MRAVQNICIVLLLCSLTSGCETTTPTNHPDQTATSSTFVHPFTRFSFPVTVTSFHRVSVKKFDRKGRDVGVGYDSSTPISATVFVYPAPKDFALLPAPKLNNVSEALLDWHIQQCKNDILKQHSDAKLISEMAYTIVQNGNQFHGKKMVFTMKYNFGASRQNSFSELYLFLIEPNVKFLVTERNFVKYRFTYPEAKKSEAESETAVFMQELVWPTN